MIALLRQLSWPELRHHPWRHGAALLAVMLGVALAFSVQLINQSALSEFSSAVRAVNGVPDFELRAQRDGFDEALYARVATHPQVAIASPAIEIDTFAFDARGDHRGERVALKIVGLDALVAGPLSPALMPRPADGADRLALLAPDAIFLNAAAQQRLGDRVRMQTPSGTVALRTQGSIAAQGAALAVMDIAGVWPASTGAAGSAASTCGCAPAPIVPGCCASSRCRPACARPRPTRRHSACPTSRAPTA